MSETAPTAPAQESTDLRRYLTARVVAVAGSLVAAVALPVLVYRLTGSPAWTAAIATAEALPYLLFGLFAGALADRGAYSQGSNSVDLRKPSPAILSRYRHGGVSRLKCNSPCRFVRCSQASNEDRRRAVAIQSYDRVGR
ncbi:MFS transporter [Pseudonocardia sp. ICBG601]|uniref:MFS transporter n=1 Tax=Pseudonocardia sp. ICBG601 TaxID=2846759 RepID=UPI001CF66D41|nr:MFS transporter [Pseudonocardia sp. ICBG601]